MGPSLHPYVYNPPQIPAMSEALGRDWRPWAPEQAGSSIGAELTPTQTDRGHLSGPDVAMRTAPPASSPKSAAWEIEKAPFEECSGHEDDSPA